MTTARADTEEAAANLALAHLKQPPIAQLTEETARARAVKAVFAAARDATLRLRWWNFAKGWIQPAAVANLVLPGPLKTAYTLSDECLLVRFVQDAQADDWELLAVNADPTGAGGEVMVLATNLTAPLLCITRRVAAVGLWAPDFLLAFSKQCAALAGPQLGASATRCAELQAGADAWREEAAKIDAQEKAPQQVSRSTSWITVRRRGGSVLRG